MSDYSIEVRDLTKRFGNFTAVDRINFTVNRGEVFGFLGANGAGKSTTIRMLCGLLESTEGTATVGGYDINTQAESVKQNIGYMSQKFSLYEDLTVEENIRFFGGVYGLENAALQKRMEWAVEMAGLKGREGSLTKELAGGWRQRLALGCAVLHKPQIVFLDEPTSGVDPVSRRNFWELISQLSEEGVTVLVTTHFLDEAEYCNDIILINAGRLIASGSPKTLKSQYITFPILEVECSNPVRAMEVLESREWVQEVSIFGTNLHVGVNNEKTGRDEITRSLSDESIEVRRIDRILPSLEDVFLHLLERDAQQNIPSLGRGV